MPSGNSHGAARAGLLAAPLLLAMFLIMPPPEGLTTAAWHTAGVVVVMAVLWISEAIPIPVTAMLPIVLFPLTGVAPVKDAAAPYANPVIFLFMGGFFLALGLQRWRLHERMALWVISLTSAKVTRVLAGFMAATAFVSMWVSNSATALMMLPIAISVVGLMHARMDGANERSIRGVGLALMLGVAYSSSIGGLGTLIGTPPNALLAGFLNETYGLHIGFGQWMLVGVPLVLAGLPLTHAVLVWRCLPDRKLEVPGLREQVRADLRQLGRLSRGEVTVAVVFALAAFCWLAQPLLSHHVPGITDATIAIGAAVALFLLPVSLQEWKFALGWDDVREFPWGVLLLIGGGLSMADAVDKTGLARWLGTLTESWQVLPIVAVVVLVTGAILFLTELTSNTATAATFLPVVASIALGMGQNPLLLTVPAALAASCAFMLPVGTPPNAVVFASGMVELSQMAKVGLWVNLVFVVLIPILAFSVAAWVFGIAPGVIPVWAGK